MHPRENDADDPPDPDRGRLQTCPGCHGTGALTPDQAARLGRRLSAAQLAKLRPPAVLYLHLAADTFLDTLTDTSHDACHDACRGAAASTDADGSGLGESPMPTGEGRPVPGAVARLEGVGPITVAQAQAFLGHCQVTIKPVLDLADPQVPVNGYEVPDRFREILHLRQPAEGSPYGTYTGRDADTDHAEPYEHDGSPGQTQLAGLVKLSRFPHRVKTHGRWRYRITRPGVQDWRSPHGYWFRVDNHGTHPYGQQPPVENGIELFPHIEGIHLDPQPHPA